MNTTPTAERIDALDAARGFALFGILVVNVYYFFQPWNAPQPAGAARFIVEALFTGKFYPVLSFLLGYGVALQERRAGEGIRRLLARRFAALAVIGVFHGVFIWTGDILLLYAVSGLAMTAFFIGRAPRVLLCFSIALIAGVLAVMGFAVGAISMLRAMPESKAVIEATDRELANDALSEKGRAAKEIAIYSHGNFAEVTVWRAGEYARTFGATGFATAPVILGLFLLGYRAERTGWLTNERARRKRMVWTIPVGLALSVYAAAADWDRGGHTLSWGFYLPFAARELGGIVLSQGYLDLILHLRVCAPVGRLALTNYLTQSIVLSTASYGYGLGLYGRIDMASGLVLAAGLYAVQLAASHLWVRHFAIGPAEWLWRKATY